MLDLRARITRRLREMMDGWLMRLRPALAGMGQVEHEVEAMGPHPRPHGTPLTTPWDPANDSMGPPTHPAPKEQRGMGGL